MWLDDAGAGSGLGRWSCGQGSDLDQVVCKDAVSSPDPGAFGGVDAGAVPAVAAFEIADPALTSSSPFDGAAERFSMLFGPPGLRRFAFTRNHYVGDTNVGELLINAGFTVAAVGGDRAWRASGPFLHSLHRGSQLRRVSRIALLDTVIEHDSVVVVDDLGLVPELDRLAESPLGDRAGIGVVQADPPGRSARGDPGDPLAALGRDLAGRGEQVGQVVDRAGQPPAPAPRRRIVDAALAQRSRCGAGAAQR